MTDLPTLIADTERRLAQARSTLAQMSRRPVPPRAAGQHARQLAQVEEQIAADLERLALVLTEDAA